MKNFFFTLLILSFSNSVQATLKDEIIQNLEITNNISFNFEQNIDGKKEKGNCIVQYPKKIYCYYDNINKKIMVSNGKSLVIKNTLSNQYLMTYIPLIINHFHMLKALPMLNIRNIYYGGNVLQA